MKKQTCKKCGSHDIVVAWHHDVFDCLYDQRHDRRNEEHLHYHCRCCRFSWTGPTKEQEHREVWHGQRFPRQSLEQLIRERAEAWRTVKEDPHNIANAVMVALLEVAECLKEAAK